MSPAGSERMEKHWKDPRVCSWDPHLSNSGHRRAYDLEESVRSRQLGTLGSHWVLAKFHVLATLDGTHSACRLCIDSVDKTLGKLTLISPNHLKKKKKNSNYRSNIVQLDMNGASHCRVQYC